MQWIASHWVALALCVGIVRPALAAWPHDPYLGNVPVCTQSASQTSPRICSDGAGGAFIVWEDLRGVAPSDIYAQHLTATGEPLWTPNGIPICTAAGSQGSPQIVEDGAGGAIIVWRDGTSGAYDIYAQRVSAGGGLQWAARGVPVSIAASNQQNPRVVADGAGGAVVCWQDFRNGVDDDIYAQRLNAAGAAQWAVDGVALCAVTGSQSNPRIVTDGAGGAIVTWWDQRVTPNTRIYAQRINTGVAQWVANGVAVCAGPFPALDPEIVSDLQGGAIVVWQDQRNGSGNYGVYAQRTNAAGTTQWPSNGVAATTETGALADALPCSDGAGGVVVCWDILRGAAGLEVVGQRISASGVAAWGTTGRTLIAATGDQFPTAIVSDGLGGAVLVATDLRSGVGADVYAQHVLSSGALLWPAAGKAVSAAAGSQSSAALARGATMPASGTTGVISVWRDFRNDPNAADVYAQQLDFNGELGDVLSQAPTIRDVPNDQGGRVKLSWSASYLDLEQRFTGLYYRIWRTVPTHAMAAASTGSRRGTTRDRDEALRTGAIWLRSSVGTDMAWEFVVGVQAAQRPSYSAVVATTSDSIPSGNPFTTFMIELDMSSQAPQLSWYSTPDSGYSVDNLRPATPAPFLGAFGAGTTHLTWNPNREADLAGYRVYRGVTPGFVPSPATLFSAQTDTGYVDPAGAPFIYKVTAVDIHGNESLPATFIPSGTVDVPGTLVSGLSLAPPSPNPSHGSTLLRYSVPRSADVRLAVFDASGRQVRLITAGVMPAGEHAVSFDLVDADGRPLPSGLYMVRLDMDGQSRTRRLLSLR